MTHQRIGVFAIVLGGLIAGSAAAADIRLGMIGLDTSHSVEYTRRLNDPHDKNFVPGARVIVAVRSGSPDMPKASMERVPGFTKELQENYGVKIVDTLEEMLPQVDAVMVENVDGRPHLREAGEVIKAGKPLAKVAKIFDVYRGSQVAEGMTSVAVRVIFYEESRSLQEAEAEAASAQILSAWKKELGAELRG